MVSFLEFDTSLTQHLTKDSEIDRWSFFVGLEAL